MRRRCRRDRRPASAARPGAPRTTAQRWRSVAAARAGALRGAVGPLLHCSPRSGAVDLGDAVVGSDDRARARVCSGSAGAYQRSPQQAAASRPAADRERRGLLGRDAARRRRAGGARGGGASPANSGGRDPQVVPEGPVHERGGASSRRTTPVQQRRPDPRHEPLRAQHPAELPLVRVAEGAVAAQRLARASARPSTTARSSRPQARPK